MSNYADFNTLYSLGDNQKQIKNDSRNNFDIVSYIFFKNYMVLSTGKCLFMCLWKNIENEIFLFNSNLKENGNEQKILGLIIDDKWILKVT